MKMKKHLFAGASGMTALFFILGAVLVLMPGTVGAQEEEYILEDTIVTATKTGETMLQETAIAMSVFDDEMIDNLIAYGLEDLANFSASFQFSRAPMAIDGVSIFIRGVGENHVVTDADQNVSMYIDGVYLHQGRGAWADMFDMERVEVLKGPQGVLWGRNNTGGAVNMVTKNPTDEFELSGRVIVGNYGLRRVDAVISGPILEGKMNARLAVSDSQQDGLIDNLMANDLRDENWTGFRSTIEVLPSDNVEIFLRGDYREIDKGGFKASKLIKWNENIPRSKAWAANRAGVPMDVLIPTDYYTVSQNESSYAYSQDWGVSAEVNISFANDITLRSVTAYRDHFSSNITDGDESALAQFYAFFDGYRQEVLTQELNLHGTWGRLTWLLGGDYMDATQEGSEYNYGARSWAFGNPPPNYHQAGGPYNMGSKETFITTEAHSVFGNLTYALTDQLSLSAGVRRTHEEKTLFMQDRWEFDGVLLPPNQTPQPGVIMYGSRPPYDEDAEWSEWTPRFVLDYKASDDLFLYLSAANGFKSGQTAAGNANWGFPTITDPETVWVYELGVKSDWLDRRLRVNGAVWKSEYEDFITSLLLPPSYGIKANYQGNAGAADIFGAEIDIVARPTQNLTLTGSLIYLDSEYNDWEAFSPGVGFVDVAGNPLKYVSEWAWNLGASYVLPIENYGFLTFGADAAWQDDQYADPFSHLYPERFIPAYTLVNGRVRYETEDGRWSLEAYARNLLEEEYYTQVNVDNQTRDLTAMLGNPMTMGVRATYRY